MDRTELARQAKEACRLFEGFTNVGTVTVATCKGTDDDETRICPNLTCHRRDPRVRSFIRRLTALASGTDTE